MEPYVSRLESEELDDVFAAILSLNDVSECYRFFEDMCTINELQAMAHCRVELREFRHRLFGANAVPQEA